MDTRPTMRIHFSPIHRGRIRAMREKAEGIDVRWSGPTGKVENVFAARVIYCTGPACLRDNGSKKPNQAKTFPKNERATDEAAPFVAEGVGFEPMAFPRRLRRSQEQLNVHSCGRTKERKGNTAWLRAGSRWVRELSPAKRPPLLLRDRCGAAAKKRLASQFLLM